MNKLNKKFKNNKYIIISKKKKKKKIKNKKYIIISKKKKKKKSYFLILYI